MLAHCFFFVDPSCYGFGWKVACFGGVVRGGRMWIES